VPGGELVVNRAGLDYQAEASSIEGKARSITLSSSSLGIIARMDIVEISGTEAIPIDYKHGRPAESPPYAWDPDKVQLCAHALLLREHGYTCTRGFVYYKESKTRVEVVIDDDLVSLTLSTINDLRRASVSGRIPPPLVDSPKCPRCSLVGICLPDETNLLSATAPKETSEVRRLVPARDNAMPLYVQAQGALISKHHDLLRIKVNDSPTRDVRLLDISHVAVLGNVQITTQALRELCARNIPVCLHSYGGWFYGIVQSMVHKNVELRLAQYRGASDPEISLRLARAFVRGKIRNQRTMIRRLHPGSPKAALAELSRLANRAANAENMDSLLGIEGAAAKTYFAHFGTLLKPEMGFDHASRNRRPPRDPVNALLSFLYAVLVKDLTVTALAIGYDPYLSFYHQPRHGRPALALDLMEEFRPLICDSTVITLINRGEIKEDDFIERAGAVSLTPRGRTKVIAAYERRMDTLVTHPVLGYSVSYRRALYVQARLVAHHIMGELASYQPFCTR
jgi:CRISPR-associated protein Cas1